MTGFVIFISIIFSAFFSGMEMAYVRSNRMLIELERKRTSNFSKATVFLIDHSTQFLLTLITGSTISLVVFGYFMGNWFLDNLYFSTLPYFFRIFIQIIISLGIVLLTAEFLTRIIFNVFSIQLFRFFSPLALFIYYILYPVTYLIIQCYTLLQNLTGRELPKEEPIVFKEELSYFIDEKIEGINEEEIGTEVRFFKNALKFSDLKARDCMINRKEIVAIDVDDNISNLTQKFVESGFSKIVVYRKNIDNIIGYVHSFDLFKNPKSIKHILFPIELIHETDSIQGVMNRMMRKSRTISIVLDEYGGTSGLLTLEDIVEELLGNIEDEYDKIEEEKELEKGHYLFSAKLKVGYLNEKYNLCIPESEEYSTLGGFILNIVEKIPSEKEEIIFKDKKIIIIEVLGAKIEKVELIYSIN